MILDGPVAAVVAVASSGCRLVTTAFRPQAGALFVDIIVAFG